MGAHLGWFGNETGEGHRAEVSSSSCEFWPYGELYNFVSCHLNSLAFWSLVYKVRMDTQMFAWCGEETRTELSIQ